MRYAESSQTMAHLDSSKQTLSRNRRKASLEMDSQDYEGIHPDPSSELYKSVDVNTSPDPGDEAALDLHQHSIHVPTRTSSRNGSCPSPRSRDLNGTAFTSSGSIKRSPSMHDIYTTSTMQAPLQTIGHIENSTELDPLPGDDPASFDLVAPHVESQNHFSLTARSQQLFSRDHLQLIFCDPNLLLKFTAFLSTSRPQSVPLLIYYLDALKALKAVAYANAIAEGLEPIKGLDFTMHPARSTINSDLDEKASHAFDALANNDLPAYITHIYIQVVSLSISRRITGTLPSHLREASEGLAEVFCLSDPSRPDNPIVFASEEFHRTTQYGTNYAIGRNCRFLQGPETNPLSVRRIRESTESGREHCEVFLNYRRDGSPFMNLLMTAPLCDSRGKIRYFIGAQVDVSGLVKNCTGLESFQRLVGHQKNQQQGANAKTKPDYSTKKDEFQELSEMLNSGELATVRRWGGRMHKEQQEDDEDTRSVANSHKPRLLLKDLSPDLNKTYGLNGRGGGKLDGVYQHYLLIRPHPSLRILFASPSLRVPGILQSPFMNKIGGSTRVRSELNAALAEGRGVTAKVRWVSRADEEGRNRWIHCTPLLGSNGLIGVWMVVLVDDDDEVNRRWRQAPPVDPYNSQSYLAVKDRRKHLGSNGDYFPSAITDEISSRGRLEMRRDFYSNSNSANGSGQGSSVRSSSPYHI